MKKHACDILLEISPGEACTKQAETLVFSVDGAFVVSTTWELPDIFTLNSTTVYQKSHKSQFCSVKKTSGNSEVAFL